MENYGTEIGQKMRSAVKAKLVELGSGGSAGYIDDELPDYVMIMVANKRSKQQMIADLNLFLGQQTELFVTWLHEVLQKLQEVTLPGSAASSKKRKNSTKEDTASSNTTTATTSAGNSKKDKKQSKKDKAANKKHSSSKDATATNESLTPDRAATKATINSITDLFAGELLEKAKQNLDAAADASQQIKKAKKHKQEPQDDQTKTPDFDIPTISEISSTTEGQQQQLRTKAANASSSSTVISGNREKDLAELAAIQKKIYAAKKQLKRIGELKDDDGDYGQNDPDEDEDQEDFLNLQDNDSRETFNEAGDLVPKAPNLQTDKEPQKAKEKSPIVFDSHNKNDIRVGEEEEEENSRSSSRYQQCFTPPPLLSAAAVPPSTTAPLRSTSTGNRDQSANVQNRRPVAERLGMRSNSTNNDGNTRGSGGGHHSTSASARERRRNLQDKEIYVPAFRRKEMEKEREKNRDRSRERPSGGQQYVRSRSRERERDRERDREMERRAERLRDGQEQNSRGRARDRRGSWEDGDREDRKSYNERNSSQVRKISTTTPAQGTARARSNSSEERYSPEPQQQRTRIGSRVIVAPIKHVESSDEDDLNDKPVNSVIKIKPRPAVSPSRQAPKNLLLKAVAEAQRSTILTKKIVNTVPSASVNAISTKSKVAARLGEKVQTSTITERNTKLFTKSYRERLKQTISGGANVGALFRRTTQKLIVEVNGGVGGSAGILTVKRKALQSNMHEDEEWQDVDDNNDATEDQLVEAGEEELHEEEQPEHEIYREEEALSDYEEIDQDVASTIVLARSQAHNYNDVEEEEEINYIKDAIHYNKKRNANVNDDGDVLVEGVLQQKTQFVVTLNDDKAMPKLKKRFSAATSAVRFSRSVSPPPQVSSSSSRDKYAEPTSTSGGSLSTVSRKLSIKERLSLKPNNEQRSLSSGRGGGGGGGGGEDGSTPPPPSQHKRSEIIETYKKSKEVKKIIIQNDSEEDELSSPNKKKQASEIKDVRKLSRRNEDDDEVLVELRRRNSVTKEKPDMDEMVRSTTPPPPLKDNNNRKLHEIASVISPSKRKHILIKFDVDEKRIARNNTTSPVPAKKRRSSSFDREHAADSNIVSSPDTKDEKRKISLREAKKYDNIPSSLNSVPVDSSAFRSAKPKERCKYHPNCTKTFCEFYHPTAPCKAFPNCKYAEKCLYSHPRCKYDLACVNLDCSFSHSGPRSVSLLEPSAPPLSSSIVPVQNYKTITTTNVMTGPVSQTTCKYFPNCTKTSCPFYHPKPCRYGKNCINKLECMFYHHEVPSSSKFKWIASVH